MLIEDDHPRFQGAMREFVARDRALEVVGEAGRVAEAIEGRAHDTRPQRLLQGLAVIMTAGQREHEVAVTAWLHGAARGGRVDTIEAFEHAFTALWRRSHLTLGEVTLTAIVERVLQSASEEYPAAAAAIEVAGPGLRCDSLRTATDVSEDQVRAALSFVLAEFLTVLGNLTAEILTPALHGELSKASSHVKCGTTEDEAR